MRVVTWVYFAWFKSVLIHKYSKKAYYAVFFCEMPAINYNSQRDTLKISRRRMMKQQNSHRYGVKHQTNGQMFEYCQVICFPKINIIFIQRRGKNWKWRFLTQALSDDYFLEEKCWDRTRFLWIIVVPKYIYFCFQTYCIEINRYGIIDVERMFSIK